MLNLVKLKIAMMMYIMLRSKSIKNKEMTQIIFLVTIMKNTIKLGKILSSIKTYKIKKFRNNNINRYKTKI